MPPQRSIRLFKYGPERAAWGGDPGAEDEEEERPVRRSPPTRPARHHCVVVILPLSRPYVGPI